MDDLNHFCAKLDLKVESLFNDMLLDKEGFCLICSFTSEKMFYNTPLQFVFEYSIGATYIDVRRSHFQ